MGEDTFGDEDTISEFESFLEEGVSELVVRDSYVMFLFFLPGSVIFRRILVENAG